MAATSSMFMYSLTLQPPSSTTHTILGQFAGGREAGNKEQHILTASGSRLTLHRVDPQLSKVSTVLEHDVFGTIRQLAAFKVAGAGKGMFSVLAKLRQYSDSLHLSTPHDRLSASLCNEYFLGLANHWAHKFGTVLSIADYIIITSDSGRIAIVEYLPTENRFKQIHLETFGKSGIRRVIPGQYLGMDAKGRACLLASVEKNKLVYVLNRNANAEITISSPLEAHKAQNLVFALIGLDVGFENPIFAALEVDYSESDQDPSGVAYASLEKELVYYELDLGLNHVVRKWSENVDRSAHMLFQVPGGSDGPSGVLVCGEDSITYRHSNQDALRVAIPRRRGATENLDRKRYITAGVMHKMRGAFFFLLQTEDGDVFKVTFEMATNDDDQATGEVRALKIKYFDTIAPATSLCILKTGYLFATNESGDHHLYQFDKLGDDDDREEFSSDDFPADPEDSYTPIYFYPGPAENLNLVERSNAMHPLISSKVINVDDSDAPQIYSVCGSGARSTFRTLRHGLEVGEIVESDLPGVPNAVWTTKVNAKDEFDAYIVLSFSNGTLVLSIGETVEEVTDTGFLSSAQTLAIQLLADDSMLQIHPNGIRHIQQDGQIQEWAAPTHRSVVAAATNSRQVAIALSSGEICYFEMDQDGSLSEYNDRKEMSANVTALSMGEVPEGRTRSPFLAVGCADQTIRILSLDPDSTLESKSIQAVTATPSALTIISMMDSASGVLTPYLHIGLQSGVYIRTLIEASGELADSRLRFLGPKAVKLFQVSVKGEMAVLALSSRPWLGYTELQSKTFMLTPLDYAPLEWSWNFHSEQCPEGVVGIEGQKLRIFTIENLTNNVLQQSVTLAYTPRGFVKHPEQPIFYVVGAESNTLSAGTRHKLQNDPSVVNGDATILPAENFGYPKGDKHWASCIQIVDPLVPTSVIETVEIEGNEAALSVTSVALASQQDEVFLFVGTGKDLSISSQSFSTAFIHTYRVINEGRGIEFVHRTEVEEPPRALIPFQGRLLAGIGPHLRIYDYGLKQLLRKTQAMNVVPKMIVGLQTQGSRIICSDIQDSVTYVVYKHNENLILPFADDAVQRWTTCTAMVDYETVAGGDKFGNLWLVRCPQKASEEADEEGSAAMLVHEKGYLQGTSNRLDLLIHTFTGDLPTSIQKTSLVPGGREVLFWSGLQGTLGVLVPFVNRDEVNLFQTLESHMREQDPTLAGRDHLTYRSSYNAVKGVIDGDLCERFYRLPRDKKEVIAADVERDVRELEKRISDMRTRVAF